MFMKAKNLQRLILALLTFASVITHGQGKQESKKADAQFAKGDKFIGGTFGLSSQTQDFSNGGSKTDISSFSIKPLIGFLINEKIALGGQIGYSYSMSDYELNNPVTSQSSSSSRFSIGFFARRYIKISDKFLFSTTGLIDFYRGTETSTLNSDYTKTQNYLIGFNIQPNFIFFPSPNWGIDASIGTLSYYYSKNLSTDYKNTTFNFNYGQFTFGLAYYFRKSTKN